MTRFAPPLSSSSTRAIDRLGVSGDHNLVRRIDVRRRANLTLTRLCANAFDVCQLARRLPPPSRPCQPEPLPACNGRARAPFEPRQQAQATARQQARNIRPDCDRRHNPAAETLPTPSRETPRPKQPESPAACSPSAADLPPDPQSTSREIEKCSASSASSKTCRATGNSQPDLFPFPDLRTLSGKNVRSDIADCQL